MEIANSQYQRGFIMIYCFVTVCRNSRFAISAGIYTDVLLCKRFVEMANSQYQRGFIMIYCFVAACGNGEFAISAGIYNDLLLNSSLWK